MIKFSAYEQAGVREQWKANPKTRSVQLYALVEGEYVLVGEFTGDETIESTLLPGLRIVTSAFFSPSP